MLVASWNIRGLGSREKKRMVRRLVNIHKPSILFLQESKLKSFDNRMVNALGSPVLNKGLAMDMEGALGGLVTLWNNQFFKVKAYMSNKNCIILAGQLVSLNRDVVMCNGYVAYIENERKTLWDFLLNS